MLIYDITKGKDFFNNYSTNELLFVLSLNSDEISSSSNDTESWMNNLNFIDKPQISLKILSALYNNDYLSYFDLLEYVNLGSGIINSITFLFRKGYIKFQKKVTMVIPEMEISITETGRKRYDDFLFAFFNIKKNK